MTDWDDLGDPRDWDEWEYEYDTWSGDVEPILPPKPKGFLYTSGKMAILSGEISWLDSEITAHLIGSEYEPDQSHQRLSDLPGDTIISSALVTGKRFRIKDDVEVESGYKAVYCDADPVQFELPEYQYGFEIGYVIMTFGNSRLLGIVPLIVPAESGPSINCFWDTEVGVFSF